MPAVRAIAYYLPQFHPIPENDEWWGKGFTEWTNVAKATPLFSGHVQPKLPSSLGFYDLRLPETRVEQAAMARESGIEGFCYWHYWFGNGKRILERPFAEVLATGSPDYPFCLCWANQSWTGIWHGNPKSLLIEQLYPGAEDYDAHFRLLLPAFKDKRYITVDGKPVFSVYAPSELPDHNLFVARWRYLAEQSGLPGLYLIAMSNENHDRYLPAFDAISHFGPADYLLKRRQPLALRVLRRLSAAKGLNGIVGPILNKYSAPLRYDFSDVVASAYDNYPNDGRHIPCVLSGWDNTPRSGLRGVVFENSTPELYRKYLAKAVEFVGQRPREERIIFIKSWNEWAEGNYLEPDQIYGDGFLQATKQILVI